jgi:crotonobetainyl-CoA:carnitine CoA-transferase CaiB-like acyl-CoA transferase
MNTPQKLSLAGLRVLEFTYAFMGPTVGPLLAELGAEVIYLEPQPCKPCRIGRGVPDDVLNIPVSQIVLNEPRTASWSARAKPHA